MKTLIFVVLALFAEVLAEGAVGRLPIGSSNTVDTFNFTNVTYAQSSVKWTNVNGGTSYRFNVRAISSSMSKQQLLDYNQQIMLNELSLSVGSDPLADKTKPVTLSVFYGKTECQYWSVSTRPQSFSYVSNQIPSLAWINPYSWEYWVSIPIKNLGWARFEVTATNNPSQPYFVIDSRFQNGPLSVANPNTIDKDIPQFAWGCINMALPFACSGSNGAYRVKTYIVSGTNNDYEVFDGSGSRVAETPLQIENFEVSGVTIRMDVRGGDIGRVFTLEKSSDMKNWVSCAGTTNVVSSEQFSRISLQKGPESQLFFRIKVLAIAPSAFPIPQARIENFKVSTDIQFDVVGADIGSKFIVERSLDMKVWAQYPTTNTITSTVTHVILSKGPESQAYFRTRTVQ